MEKFGWGYVYGETVVNKMHKKLYLNNSDRISDEHLSLIKKAF